MHPNVPEYSIGISVWVRWLFLFGALVDVNYRVEYGSLSHILNNLYLLSAVLINGAAYYRIRRNRDNSFRWLLVLSAMDAAMITFSTSLSGGMTSRYFVLYYFNVAFFAAVFSSVRLNLFWVTLVAISCVATSFISNSGISIAEQHEKDLLYRIGVLYGVAGVVNLITTVERFRRRQAVERERELQRQRIEISQSIHDSTAQLVYIVSLGAETALELAGESEDELREKLEGMAQLSRSIMWELRHPIDGGQIFRGKDLGSVLRAHIETFTSITSIPAELELSGDERPLTTIEGTILFSIAHNALTNALRHSQANHVVVRLRFGAEDIALSVSDDGMGLPVDYREGHGIRNMRADAERHHGRLELATGDRGRGTRVTCVIPSESFDGRQLE